MRDVNRSRPRIRQVGASATGEKGLKRNSSLGLVGIVLTLTTLGALPLRAGGGPEPPAPARARGIVVARDGSPVAGARVAERGGNGAATDAGGSFDLALRGSPPVLLVVRADGYTEAVVEWAGGEPLRIELSPKRFTDAVTVTAARVPARLGEEPASVLIVTEDDIRMAPQAPIDAVLRQIPGFTLFRRSDSRTANPTAQGVSLRGVGGSGASRALVLDDGVPLNDPFGGWVAWGRVVEPALERVEVLRGGASDRYGAPALSGVIQMVRREPAGPALSAEVSYGSKATADAQVFAAGAEGSWSARIAAAGFRTDGFVLVSPGESGPVDVPARSRHATADAAVERSIPAGRLFLRGAFYDEDRGNGTPLQVNDTRLWQVAFGADGVRGSGEYALRVYGLEQTYRQAFSAVASDRESERLTRIQEVPSSAAGMSAQWETDRGPHRLLFGAEGRVASGASNEIVVTAGGDVSDAGGRQATAAGFVQDRILAGPRVSVTLGLRFDVWRNSDAFRRRGPRGAPTEVPLESRTADSWSPRVGIVYAVSPAASLTASAYRAFRAPTLNELYREFRVGNSVTLANENLGPETLVGGEAGAMMTAFGGALFSRATLFWSELDDAIVNRTLETTPELVTRQRQNLGRSRARGAEVDLEGRLGPGLRISAGYLFVDSRVIAAGDDASLAGKRTPQVPRHQASLQLYGAFGRARFAVSGRHAAAQYEDDLNSLRLPGFTTLDAQAAFALSSRLEIFLAAENLTDRRVVTGRTPLATLGPSREVRGGFRARLD